MLLLLYYIIGGIVVLTAVGLWFRMMSRNKTLNQIRFEDSEEIRHLFDKHASKEMCSEKNKGKISLNQK
ncbi:hypothetical protein C7S20_18490 [Christiangramia fulva]|uniref:Uncharacterized protein n=1 Tax=Christiangramia fulva TaxID=2126553 RepID=A0A2R3Z9X5_9FLAO|nr:hypothetical protein [Christiangramia fulva]AVR47076.1 hypothetical protein C7S20_18490 [Christiangramia fulva]